MAISKPWTFAQLAGDQTILSLGGWAGPFGRPRQSSIVNTGVSIRHSVTYYADGNKGPTPPTVHAFGSEPKPFELHGRWMDRAMGAVSGVPGLSGNTARGMQRAWKDFVQAKQVVRAKWGDILSYLIFFHDADLQFESEFDLVWKLTAITILDEQSPVPKRDTPNKTPIDMATLMAQALIGAMPILPPDFNAANDAALTAILAATSGPNFAVWLQAFSGAITDTVTQVTEGVVEPFIQIWQIAHAISDFQTARSSDLTAILTGLQTIKAAMEDVRNLTTQMVAQAGAFATQVVDIPNGAVSGPDAVSLYTSKIQSDAETANLLALISDLQTQVLMAQRGQASTAVQAQDTDTWESIATRQFGDPSGARAIRDMNGVRYGQRPQAGRAYHVPQKA